ncbi:hypothetical protein MAP00_003027 [Monascus purpureus]|nr:hypothetical protein MAP00_003027 [Monascus purpureus]
MLTPFKILFVAFCSCMLVLNSHGGGYHAWDVPMDNFVSFQKASYATTLLYVPTVFVVKLALLAIMLRIFAPDPTKATVIYISVAVLVCYYIPMWFIKIFFCRPISAYWNGPLDKCINQQKVIIADSVLSIVSDLWILILPVPMLWSLQITRVKKIRVSGILGAGGLATAFSIWRLVIMVEEGKTTDTTYFWIHAVLTANAEAGIGLICACLPMLNVLFATVKNKSSEASHRKYPGSRELETWQKTASRKSRSVFFTGHHNDEAQLISTIQGPEPHEGSWSSLSSHPTTADQQVIHKDVTVSQSYEIVK